MYEADLNSDDQVQEKDDEIHQTQEIGQPGNTNYDNTKEIISPDYELPTFDNVNREIESIKRKSKALTFKNVVQVVGKENQNTGPETFDENEKNSFNFVYKNNKPIEHLDLKIGESVIHHHSCGCHKLNLVVRRSISRLTFLCNILKELNKSNSTIRKTIELNRVFEKSRLRLENLTRWSSAYLMLESVKNAYDKNLFDEEIPELKCPVDYDTVEIFIQVLKPAYDLTIQLQYSHSSIADLIPGIRHLQYLWENMNVENEFKEFSSILTLYLKTKFEYELNNSLYKSASVLKIAAIKYWMSFPFSADIIKDGLENISEAYWLVFGRDLLNQTPRGESDGFTFSYLNKDNDQERVINNEVAKTAFNLELTAEIKQFSKLLIDQQYLKTLQSTRHFWTTDGRRFPKIKALALVLMNIPSSSAYIERFFSIAGVINNKRCPSKQALSF